MVDYNIQNAILFFMYQYITADDIVLSKTCTITTYGAVLKWIFGLTRMKHRQILYDPSSTAPTAVPFEFAWQN